MGKFSIWNSIDYNTYIRIEREIVAGYVAAGSGLYITRSSYSALMNVIFTSLLIYIIFQDGSKTKDVKEIKELYDIFVSNYSELIKMFELSDPLEIFELYIIMLREGMLSKDGVLDENPNSKNFKDIDLISGANICLGNGVCRHMSALLSDILNKTGIESDVLIGKYMDIPLDLATKITIKDFADSHMIDSGIEVDIPVPQGKPDHMITVAKKDGCVYYLDSMNERIFHMPSGNSKLLVNDLGVMKIFDLRLKLHKYTGLKISKKEEEMQASNNVAKLVNENMDVLSKFYTDNKELYDEISDKMLKIRRKIFK